MSAGHVPGTRLTPAQGGHLYHPHPAVLISDVVNNKLIQRNSPLELKESCQGLIESCSIFAKDTLSRESRDRDCQRHFCAWHCSGALPFASASTCRANSNMAFLVRT